MDGSDCRDGCLVSFSSPDMRRDSGGESSEGSPEGAELGTGCCTPNEGGWPAKVGGCEGLFIVERSVCGVNSSPFSARESGSGRCA